MRRAASDRSMRTPDPSPPPTARTSTFVSMGEEIYRIRVEERALVETLGERYRAYR